MSANHSETIINNYNNEMATSTIPTTNTIITTMNDNNNDYNSNFEILFMLQVKYRIIGNVLDISTDPEVYYRVVLFGYITPIFFLITFAANILIVLVLSRPTMRSPTNLVLLSMAVADLLTLIFPVPWYFYMYTLGYYKFLLYPALSCNLYHVMSGILPTFFHTASIWCTLLLACQRYIYICHPTLAKVWCTNKRVTRTILAIFLLASVHQLLRFFESHWIDTIVTVSYPQTPTPSSTHKSIFDDDNAELMSTKNEISEILLETNNETIIINEPQKACRQVIAKWITSIENLYFGTYFVFRIVFVHIGPCLLLVIFNVLLYNALKRAEKTRNKLLNKQHRQHSSEQRNGSSGWIKQQQSDDQLIQRKANRGRDANSTTVMLIVVVTVFLIVEIPLAVATAIHVTENMFTVDIVSDHFLSMTIIFSNFLIIISYPLNFAIYCGMSRAFRETFQQMFLKNIFEIRPTTRSSTTVKATTTLTTMTNILSTDNNTNINNNTITLQPKPPTISSMDQSKISNTNIISLSTPSNQNDGNNNDNDKCHTKTLKSHSYNDKSERISSNSNNNTNNNLMEKIIKISVDNEDGNDNKQETNQMIITINTKHFINQKIENKINTNNDDNNKEIDDKNDDVPKETMV